MSAEPAPAVLRVALDVPMRRLFDYLPPGRRGRPRRQRVRVPFGRQRLVGLVVGQAATSEVPADRLKPVLEVLDYRGRAGRIRQSSSSSGRPTITTTPSARCIVDGHAEGAARGCGDCGGRAGLAA